MRAGTKCAEENVVFEAIPAEMKTYRAWVCWRYEERDGEKKPTKVPYDPLTGRRASSTDSRTWRRFEEAVEALDLSKRYDGIGFVFSSGDPYAGIDLDDCRDPETGELEPRAQEIVAASGESSYAEASPSGRGVHIIVKGRAPNKRRGRIEVYSELRFFTITGRAL
jgi:putative DNA primase/helicase